MKKLLDYTAEELFDVCPEWANWIGIYGVENNLSFIFSTEEPNKECQHIFKRPNFINAKDYIGKKVAVWDSNENPIIAKRNADNPVIATLIAVDELCNEQDIYGVRINVKGSVLCYYRNMRPLTKEEIKKEQEALEYKETV
jgi:hypothetical protein